MYNITYIYVYSDRNKISYTLIAVAVHIGKSMSLGHYIAYVKREDKWYKCDDSKIHEVSNGNNVLSSDAYLLFYRQL